MAEPGASPASRKIPGEIHRIVPSRYPPVGLFDTATEAEHLEMLAELEGLTNDRIRETLGELAAVAPGEGVYGPGCTPIMAAFCHPQISRFSNGDYGIYYAARSVLTAIAETVFHREEFLRNARIPNEVLEMRCYTASLIQPMAMLPTGKSRGKILDPHSYAVSQPFGSELRSKGAWGIYYPSVRDRPDGRCVAVLRPKAIRPAVPTKHFRYVWDGTRIVQIEEYTRSVRL